MSTNIQKSDNIIETEDVTVRYDMDRGVSRVVDNVSIDIRRGEVLGLVGESGSGKSMVASALLNAVIEPGQVDGEINYTSTDGSSIDIIDASSDELRELRWEEIAMVFQGAMSFFNPTLSIRGHFVETLEAHDYDLEEGMDRAEELLRELHLDPDRVLDSYPHELSGGMSQRTLIALSLILEPEVLIMDEPTAALDLLMQRSILSLIENIQETYNLTILFITHDLPLITDLCDRIAVMYAFQIVETLSTIELEEAKHPYTRSLLNSVPDLSVPLDELRSIGGVSPDPVDPPQGCSYHPRCPLSTEECRTRDPKLESIDTDSSVACFHYEQSEEEIPLVLESPDSQQESYEGRQSEEPIVTLDDLEVHFEEEQSGLFNIFESPNVVRAVDGVNLDIYDNDVIAVVGESGCGKTTLGKAAVALQEPTGGTVNYQGRDIWEAKRNDDNYMEIRRNLQIIHQDPGSSLNPNRKVENILEVPLKRWHHQLDKEDRRARILAMLETAGMTPPDDYADRFPNQLSGGEKQRVALIRALLMNPDLILADEAVSALDVSVRVNMMDQMIQLQDLFDTSYLFVSHNLTNARYLAGRAGGRIAVMYLGEVIEIGPVKELINNPKHPYTKALHWATTNIEPSEETGEAPVRGIDIPDPVDPPSGCRFHTRCPEAREVCTQQKPTMSNNTDHRVACFMECDQDHPYWDSKPIVPSETTEGEKE